MLFTFPSRYWFTIGLSGVFSLAGWSRRIRSGLHVSRLTQESAMIHKLTCTGLSPSVITFSKVFHFIYFIMSQSYYPATAETITVWAYPRSLAATGGITFVFFSCRYLDVSVPCVCLPYGIICLQHIGLSHSEISASKVICT